MKLFKKKKRKQEKWISVQYGDQWMNVKENAFIKDVIIVKDYEGNYRVIKGRVI